ncbi:Succinate--hydroxymethylglutarate CoA-transferase [Colletotrichum higginsianum]|nr:Succinate--hydroxymethylglutarate CoA-transferase [Colletotrichum higginsianum]
MVLAREFYLLLRYQLTFCVRAYAGAIDLDVYGALQYCSIGILAGPVTVKLSTTYSNERGRNIIFLWTGLILAGLLSLAVEFYRAKSTPCFFDNAGNPISQDPGRFPYSEAMCGLTCSQENGPSSLLRTKAASEIFVVPVPTKLPLGNSMFLAAAECVPAILSLVSMWVKITNPDVENGRENEPIPGANGATFGNMKSINARIRDFLNAVEIPVFAGAVVAILIIGEINFSSPQMDYHTEPMGSIGQWGTILATGMAAFGSLYIYLAGMFMADQDDAPQEEARRSAHLTQKRSNEPHVEMEDYPVSPGDHGDPLARATSDGPESDQDQGYRRTISNALIKVNRFFGNKVQPSLQPDNYGNGVWPQIPGEMERNSRVTVTMDQFSMHNFRLSTSRDSHESYSGTTIRQKLTMGNPSIGVSFRIVSRAARCRAVPSRLTSAGRRCYSSVPSSKLPLDGYRVLDMTRVLAGPYCTQILGDLGAEVIKVEHPVRGDDTRAWGPPYAAYKADSSKEGPGESAYFLAVNRNKKSLGLNFQHPDGTEILHGLVSKCDILVENYLPGTLRKYGMDYETLRAINPGLIYTSITGYGQTGPYSDRAGYDVMVEAEFGLMHITGSRDGEPVKVGVAVTDLTTGLYTSNSIMAALLARARTGKGQHIDVALSDCQTATLANIASSCLISGKKDSGRWGTAHPSIVPYKSFKTKDGDILFGGGNDRLYGILCEGLGRPEWRDDAKYRTNAQRVANRVELEALIEAVTVTRTTAEWLAVFEGRGMPYAAVNDVQGALGHEHTLARGMVVEMEHGECGPIRMVNTPVKYSDSEPRIRTAPPTLGQHTSEVLGEHLGLSEERIRSLKGSGVLG